MTAVILVLGIMMGVLIDDFAWFRMVDDVELHVPKSDHYTIIIVGIPVRVSCH